MRQKTTTLTWRAFRNLCGLHWINYDLIDLYPTGICKDRRNKTDACLKKECPYLKESK